MLRPRGGRRARWDDELGIHDEVDAGPLAAVVTAHSRDRAFARALLAPPLDRLTVLPAPPGPVVVDGSHVLLTWDGPLDTVTLEAAVEYLLALVAFLPPHLPAASGRRRGRTEQRSGIERFVADTAGRTLDESRGWSLGRAGRDLAAGDPFIGSRRPGA